MAVAEEYSRCIDTFIKRVATLGDDLEMILLYGSVVRDAVIPGVSDLIDAVVVLRDSAVADENKLYSVLDSIVYGCEPAYLSGLPFHPCHWYKMSENHWSSLPFYIPAWKSLTASSVAYGNDIRAALQTTDCDYELMRGWYFSLFREIAVTGALLEFHLSHCRDRATSFEAFRRYLRDLPQFACFACRQPVDRTLGIEKLRQLFPQRDLDRLKPFIERTFIDSKSDDDQMTTRKQLRDVLALNDQLYEDVLSWIALNG